MKQLVLIFMMLMLSGCAQLMKGQQQPVTLIDAKQDTYFTSCSGTVEDWGSCNNKARQTCKGAYEVLNKLENPVGGRRELTFRCVK
jgi:uncharacterized protein YceK